MKFKKKSTVIDFPDKYVEIGSARSPEIGLPYPSQNYQTPRVTGGLTVREQDIQKLDDPTKK